jgi:transcriptional regulator with XRE-family HTH domain
MDNIALGKKVAVRRKQLKLSTTELAERTGLSQPQISRLEHGRQGFRSATLSKISDALGVTPAYFFADEKEKVRAALTADKKLREKEGNDVLTGITLKLGEVAVLPGYRHILEKLASAVAKNDCDLRTLRRLMDKILSASNEERLRILNRMSGQK